MVNPTPTGVTLTGEIDMDDFIIDKKANVAFSSSKLAVDWYQKQYHRLLEENALLSEELQALIRQNNELQRLL